MKIRDWEDLIDNDDEESFEKFSHKTKMIRERREDIYRQKRREKKERLEFEENAYKGVE